MSKKDFESMLNKHHEDLTKEKINWTDQKKEWLGFIEQFYEKVELWVQPYLETGQLSYNYRKTILTEDDIGSYEVGVMEINFAGQHIKLEPIGTLLIGTKGRIDMEGARGRVQFILADKNSKERKIISTNDKALQIGEPDWTWKIILRESRKIAYEDFNEENFFSALMEIAHG
jgi:hypothetical protein